MVWVLARRKRSNCSYLNGLFGKSVLILPLPPKGMTRKDERLIPGDEAQEAGLVSRKWVDTRSVIPAKAGIQITLLWIPAFAGKTMLGRECLTISPLQSCSQDITLMRQTMT